jgi:phage terminase Nu1 subunit (DNA packaging protein)
MATIAEAASHIFLNERNFSRQVDSGVIDRAYRGQYDLDVVREQYIVYLRERAAGRERKGPLDPSQELARKNKELADKTEMANMVARGALIREDVVKKFIIDAFTRLRTRMLGLPTKLAIRLVGLKSAIEIQKILDDGIREALAELSEHSVLESAEAESAERAREAGGLLEGSEATS